MAPTTVDAASYVRARLGAMDTRLSQSELQTLVRDLQSAMGRLLTPGEAAQVVEVFSEVAADRSNAVACAA